MLKWLIWVARTLALLVLALVVFWLVAPRDVPIRSTAARPDFSVATLENALVTREAQFSDIVPGTEARIIWAGEPGTLTPFALLYLHGFSASSEEIRPVPDTIAATLGANLIYARLPGHGRTSPDAMDVGAGAWIDAALTFLDAAAIAGEEVIVLSTSTGSTLAALLETEPDAAPIRVQIMVSPNFALASPLARILDIPMARTLLPPIFGERRSFEPQNERHARYWTTEYPSTAAIDLATLLRETHARDYSGVTTPALMMFSERDQVVSAAATRDFAEAWGGEVTLNPVTLPAEGADPFHHVIAGDIISPALTAPVVQTMLDWLASQGIVAQ